MSAGLLTVEPRDMGLVANVEPITITDNNTLTYIAGDNFITTTDNIDYITTHGSYTTDGTWWEDGDWSTAVPNTQPIQEQLDWWYYPYPDQPIEDQQPQPLPDIPFEPIDLSELVKKIREKNLNKKIKIPFEF